MNLIGSITSWLLRSGKVHDPFPSHVPSGVIPIRTSASILRYQPPISPASGSIATAREPAVAQNPRSSHDLADGLFERQPDDPPSYQKIDPHFNILGQAHIQHAESRVNIETYRSPSEDDEGTNAIIRKDPFACLPPELTATILSHLDSTSLARSELVSKTWSRVARQPHPWKEVFRNETHRERQNSMAPSNQYSISGAGLGTASPIQNYKLMLQARRTLQKRWRDGRASAIYLEGHTDSVYCVQFDEEKMVTGSRDQTIRIWDSRNYKCTKMLGVPTRSSVNNRLQIQTHGEGQPGRPLEILIPRQEDIYSSGANADLQHNGSVLCLQYDDEILVSGSSDTTCIVWEIKQEYRPLYRLRSHAAGVLDVCFDREHIVSCSKDTTICVWNRHTGERLRQMSGHRGPVNAVQLRGDLIVSASGDGVAKLWSLASGQCIKEFPSKDRGMACVDFSLDSRAILAGGNDQVVYQFDSSTGTIVREMAGHQGLVRSLYLDNTNGRIVSGSYDASIRAYDFATGKLITAFVQWATSWILSAKSDYRRIVAASQDSRIVIIDFGHGVPNIDLLAM
ncbi:MAG: hypothetical protein Q9195_000987 [Heterodermia aff. obscurata]